MKIKFLFVTFLTLSLLFALGCNQTATNSGSGNSSAGDAAKKRIGVSLLTREDDFYRELEAGLQEAARQNNYELIIQSGDKDLSKQQSQIDNFLVQKVDAIILCPTDTQGIAPAIERANAANVPVFTADIAAGGGKIVSHVASDNVAGGRLAAEYIVKALNGEGAVGIIGQPEVQSVVDRETGFKAEIAKNPKITLVPTLNGGGVRDRALKAADDLIQANPNLKAIFCINDETALGALAAAEARGKTDLIIVGYDAAPEAVAKIRAGTALKADVAQQPRDIGAKTIEAIAKHFKGEPAEAKVAVPVKIIDIESAK
ncbi:MAG: substrate-binding domain-containing protein [Acidobacteriota bacterium]|nr:substrate-binding domain-containing protein [Acidobacteriota bacterium]